MPMRIRYPQNNIASGSVASSAIASGAVSGPKIASSALRTVQTVGRNGAGNITLNGLAAGDVLMSVQNVTDNSTATTSFTSPVASANTLAQTSASDLSGKTFLITVKSGS